MKNIICYDNLDRFAYSNDKRITEKGGKIRGIVIDYFGLGNQSMFGGPFRDTEKGDLFAAKDVVILIPYGNPWAWMNRAQVEYADTLIDVLFDHYSLDEKTPIVSTGESMGGQECLTYMAYAKRTPVAAVANCPVCDLPYHFTERVDLPRTLYSAFHDMDGELDDVLATASPYHLVDKMPKGAEYRIIHCTNDGAVNLQKHSERFVEKMKENGFNITLDRVPNRDHCDLPAEYREKFYQYMFDAIDRYAE